MPPAAAALAPDVNPFSTNLQPGSDMNTWRIAGTLLVGWLPLGGVAEASSAKATADMKDATGRSLGEALLEQRDGAVQITGALTGLPPGTRAFHIHEVGVCEPPFESAGGHFNPTGKRHGKDNPGGAHAGDLPNLEVPSSLLDGDGAALVIHDGRDDYKTDPAGSAGKRLACGVIHR
jgi:Cu-Zn family superoxide dismutase